MALTEINDLLGDSGFEYMKACLKNLQNVFIADTLR